MARNGLVLAPVLRPGRTGATVRLSGAHQRRLLRQYQPPTGHSTGQTAPCRTVARSRTAAGRAATARQRHDGQHGGHVCRVVVAVERRQPAARLWPAGRVVVQRHVCRVPPGSHDHRGVEPADLQFPQPVGAVCHTQHCVDGTCMII